MAAAAVAGLVALLAADNCTVYDCVCSRLYSSIDKIFNELVVWRALCAGPYLERTACDISDRTTQLGPWGQPAVDDFLASFRRGGGRGLGPVAERHCSAALAAIRQLSDDVVYQIRCDIVDACKESCSAQGLNDTMWNEEILRNDDRRHSMVAQIMHAVWRIIRILGSSLLCISHRSHTAAEDTDTFARDFETWKGVYSKYWRDTKQLYSVGATHISHLVIPLAFENMDNHTNIQQLHRWITNMEHVRDMMNTKFMGLLQDMESASKQLANYIFEEDNNRPNGFIVRRPLLSEALLRYRQYLVSFRDVFGAACEQLQPNASQIFGLADDLYSFYRQHYLYLISSFDSKPPIDEEWRLADQSGAWLSADTGCLQLLVDQVERPACPLEGAPPETAECRLRLWRDLALRPPPPPVTSYLAYTQRAPVSLCLLAWLVASSSTFCLDVPFSVIQSVHDARCYFDNPGNSTCFQSNETDAICYVSRAILLLKCRDFFSFKTAQPCVTYIRTTMFIAGTDGIEIRETGKATNSTKYYKDNLKSATLRYKDFKVDSLKPLEYSFVAINIFFRFSAAAVYMYFPQLGNLPGKIFLSFQVTGLLQILCSEVLRRLAGVPDLFWAVQLDGALTLLGCLWLTAFCYRMYACARHLSLPDHLPPSVASAVFRRQALCVLLPWGVVCGTCMALELSGTYYLIYSRSLLLTAISLSVCLNLIFLALVAYMYKRNKASMKRLKISTNDNYFSKKQLMFLSVNTVLLSGIGVIIRIGFHQAKGIAQYVYYVHVATMLLGPLLFVFFVCNDTTLPLLRNKVLALWHPEIISPERELPSSAERILERRRREQHLTAESSL